MLRVRTLFVLLCASAPAARAQSISSVGGGLLTPIGNFHNLAYGSGWGIAYRNEFQLPVRSLRVRTDLALDHFTALAPAKSYEYQSIGANLVHYNGEVFYQYAGISLMTAKTTLNATGTGVVRNPTRNEFAFGTQAGVGVIMLIWRVQPFLEAGIANANARSVKGTWIPVRFGVRL